MLQIWQRQKVRSPVSRFCGPVAYRRTAPIVGLDSVTLESTVYEYVPLTESDSAACRQLSDDATEHNLIEVTIVLLTDDTDCMRYFFFIRTWKVKMNGLDQARIEDINGFFRGLLRTLLPFRLPVLLSAVLSVYDRSIRIRRVVASSHDERPRTSTISSTYNRTA